MEVSDAFSIHKLVKENTAIRIVKLKHLIVQGYDWNTSQCELFVDAIKHCTSLTSLRLPLANYNLVYLLRNILPSHPTIRSVTIQADNSSRHNSVEKMIQDAHWTELKFIAEEDPTHRASLLSKICRGLMKNNTITTLDLSRCFIEQRGIENLKELFKVNNTINSLLIDVDSEANLDLLSNVLQEKKQLISFGILGAIEQDGNWTTLAQALRANTSLTHLELHPQVSEGSAQEIVELIHNNQLKSLEGDFYDEDMDLIYEAMLANTSLTSLDFGGSYYNNCDLVSEVIKVHPALKHFSLSVGSSNKSQIVPIFDALRHNTSITSLNIAGSTFDTMWQEIREMFSFNTTVRHLTVSDSCFYKDDWKFFKEVLCSSSALKSLTYTNSLPEHSEWEEMCQGIKMNSSLTSLVLKVDDDMSKATLDTLFAALKGNTTLRSLTIEAPAVNLSKYHQSSFYDNLNLESVLLIELSLDSGLVRQIEQRGFERKVARRREVTNLIISLFNIARRPESFDLFPAEIWLQIFRNINSTYLDVHGVFAAILTDHTIRKMVDFDKDVFVPFSCTFE